MTFKEKVYKITREIPRGKVATYSQLARLAGKAKGARAVGLFMRTNSDAPRTPCHRVVASDGKLNGYSGEGGLITKKKMLIDEGVIFKEDKVDFAKCLWTR